MAETGKTHTGELGDNCAFVCVIGNIRKGFLSALPLGGVNRCL